MSGYYHKELAGVGGWLTFFLIVIGVLTPLRIIFVLVGAYATPEVAAGLGDQFGTLLALEGTLSIIQLAICGFIVWRLLKVETWQTVRLVIACLWIGNIVIPAFDLVVVSYMTAFPIGDLLLADVSESIRGVVFPAIWTAYFLRSERVANTYLRQDKAEDMAEVFN